jgi:peroxiredoxin
MHNPFVPETLEGWSVLHLMYRIDWAGLRASAPGERQQLAREAAAVLAQQTPTPEDGATAWVQMLGHKADLMVVAFRRTFDDLGRVDLALAQTPLHQYLVPTTSYVSIVELGMYEMTAKIHRQIGEAGLKPESDDYTAAFDAEMARQRNRVMSRLFLDVPKRRHVCFYPMNKKRGEAVNWYSEPFERRADMMLEHGKIGRHYAGQVTQVISGSIGLDDWEWGARSSRSSDPSTPASSSRLRN